MFRLKEFTTHVECFELEVRIAMRRRQYAAQG